MRDGLALVEQSLLEADVSYSVAKDFVARVAEEAMGEKVLLALNPTQQLIGIIHQELINTLGPVDPAIPLRKDVTILMMCGLQGSGKTTTCGKLAKLLRKTRRTCLLVAADLQRPAAIEQLHVIGRQLDVPVFSEPGAQEPDRRLCRGRAKGQGRADSGRRLGAYALALVPVAVMAAGSVLLVEMSYRLATQPELGTRMRLLWTPVDAASPWPWVVAMAALGGGFLLFRSTWPVVAAAWERARAEASA